MSRGRPRKFDERQVLDAITDVFWQRGYAGTSLDAIASASGLVRPSLYGAFGNKEQIYLRAIEQFAGRAEAAVGVALSESAPLLHSLTAVFDALIELYASDTHAARGCMIACTAAAEAESTPRIQQALHAVFDTIDALFDEILSAAKKAGEVDEAADTMALARVLAGAVHTIALRARAGGAPDSLRGIASTTIDLVVGHACGPGS